MVITYWTIGKQIVETQGSDTRAGYGTGLIKYLSERLTDEFGKFKIYETILFDIQKLSRTA